MIYSEWLNEPDVSQGASVSAVTWARRPLLGAHAVLGAHRPAALRQASAWQTCEIRRSRHVDSFLEGGKGGHVATLELAALKSSEINRGAHADCPGRPRGAACE